MSAFKTWTVVFPGKMNLSWKRASFFDYGTREEAEAEAARYANVVAVPVELRDHLKEVEHRMVAAERKLNEFGVRQDYKDGAVSYVELGYKTKPEGE